MNFFNEAAIAFLFSLMPIKKFTFLVAFGSISITVLTEAIESFHLPNFLLKLFADKPAGFCNEPYCPTKVSLSPS